MTLYVIYKKPPRSLPGVAEEKQFQVDPMQTSHEDPRNTNSGKDDTVSAVIEISPSSHTHQVQQGVAASDYHDDHDIQIDGAMEHHSNHHHHHV